MNTKDLKQYLKYVKMLEARAYEQKAIYSKLSSKINYYSNKSYPSCKEFEIMDSIFSDPSGIGAVALIILFFIFLGFCIGFGFGIKMHNFIICIKNGALLGALFGIVVLIVMRIHDFKVTEQYNREIAKYNLKTSKNNEAMQAQDRKKIQIYKKEQDVIRKQYNETLGLLQKAYQLNILHPKYQNFVAVCSLYEYLETERCTQLTGHEGGYNIFEMEKRMNLIILKMDEIIDNLNKIQENQYGLYSAITTSNRNVDRICKQVSVVSEQLGDIEKNQALIEYNTKIAANNSEFLKWLAYFQA